MKMLFHSKVQLMLLFILLTISVCFSPSFNLSHNLRFAAISAQRLSTVLWTLDEVDQSLVTRVAGHV